MGRFKFFQACTNYQTSLAGRSATTDSLKNYFNTVLGTDISQFFAEYVGGSGSAITAVGGVGNPINNINWNSPQANTLAVQVGSQNKTGGSNVSYFNGPVVLHVTNGPLPATKDTTIVFFDWGGGSLSFAGNGLSAPIGGNLLIYNLSFTPTNVFYDDSARTLSTGTITKISTLAVNILNFTASKTSTGNQINLSIAYNEPVDKVILLKSADGTNFSEAGLMTKTNTSGSVNNYQFNDVLAFSPATFYRAKIYTAGKEEYSAIVKVQQSVSKDLVVSPNPAKDVVNISFNNSDRLMATIRVINTDGKAVIESSTKNDFIHFDVSNLSAGIYLVHVIKPGQVTDTNKFLVHH